MQQIPASHEQTCVWHFPFQLIFSHWRKFLQETESFRICNFFRFSPISPKSVIYRFCIFLFLKKKGISVYWISSQADGISQPSNYCDAILCTSTLQMITQVLAFFITCWGLLCHFSKCRMLISWIVKEKKRNIKLFLSKSPSGLHYSRPTHIQHSKGAAHYHLSIFWFMQASYSEHIKAMLIRAKWFIFFPRFQRNVLKKEGMSKKQCLTTALLLAFLQRCLQLGPSYKDKICIWIKIFKMKLKIFRVLQKRWT